MENKGLRFFDRIELDLGDVRALEEHKVFGDVLVVETIDGVADCYFNETESDYIELDKTRKVYMDYWRIFITNTAQEGKTCVLLCGRQGTFDGVSDVAKESKQNNVVTPSDNLLISSDVEVTATDPAWTIEKEILILLTGTYRVYHEMHAHVGGWEVRSRIYLNGVAYGTLRISDSGVYLPYTEDLFLERDDLLQLYGNEIVDGRVCYLRNFRLSGDVLYGVGVEQSV